MSFVSIFEFDEIYLNLNNPIHSHIKNKKANRDRINIIIVVD